MTEIGIEEAFGLTKIYLPSGYVGMTRIHIFLSSPLGYIFLPCLSFGSNI